MIQCLLPAIQTKNLNDLKLEADIGTTHDMEQFIQWVKDGAGWIRIEYTLYLMKIDYANPVLFRLVLSLIEYGNPRILLHLVGGERTFDHQVAYESLLAKKDLQDPKLLDYIELFTSDKFITDISRMIEVNRTTQTQYTNQRLWYRKTFGPVEQYVQNSLEAVQA